MFTINKIIEVSFDVLLSRNKWVFEVKLLLSFWRVSLSELCFELTPPLQMFINPKLKIDTAIYKHELNNLKQKKSSMVAKAQINFHLIKCSTKQMWVQQQVQRRAI